MNIIEGEYEEDFLRWRTASGRTIEITDIQIMSERRQGRGRELVQKLFGIIEKEHPTCNLVWAITRTTNQIAQIFYESLGFRVVGVLRQFYEDDKRDDRRGVDAIMFGRSPKGSI